MAQLLPADGRSGQQVDKKSLQVTTGPCICPPDVPKQGVVAGSQEVSGRARLPTEACLLRLRALGLTAGQIAALHGLPQSLVSYLVVSVRRRPLCPACRQRLAGLVAGIVDNTFIDRSRAKAEQSELRRSELRRLRELGLSVVKIVSRSGLSYRQVWQLLAPPDGVKHPAGCPGCPSLEELFCDCRADQSSPEASRKGRRPVWVRISPAGPKNGL